MSLSYKGGKRADMSLTERAFARVYDRLRKRTLRREARAKTTILLVFNDGYEIGYKTALDHLAVEMEELDYLSDTL
jgi:hypothetical protein